MAHDMRIDSESNDYIDYMAYKLRPAASAASARRPARPARPAPGALVLRGQPALRPGCAEAGVAGPSG